MNLEICKKISESFTLKYIGETEFSDDEIEEMIEDCREAYRKISYGRSLTATETDELVVLIVNVIKRGSYDNEDKFWVKLYSEIFDDGNILPQKFYKDIENCFNRHKKTLYKSKENKRMFRETFLSNAFSPESSTDEFIRLLWDWYSDPEVLDFSFYPNDTIYSKLTEYLSLKFKGEKDLDEDVDFEGKTYRIKASFKYLFTQDTDNAGQLLLELFSYIDEVYRQEEIPAGSFLRNRCNDVVNKILDEAKIPRRRGGAHTRTSPVIDDYSKIHLDYELNSNNEPVIILPEIRAIDEIADDYYLTVYLDGKEVYRHEGYIVGSGIKRKIKRVEIPLSFLRNSDKTNLNISAKLFFIQPGTIKGTKLNRLIYDSKESLFREYILFKLTREIRSEISRPGSYILVSPPELDIHKASNCAIGYINGYTSSVIAEEGMYINCKYKKTYFTANSKINSQFSLKGKKINSLFYVHNGTEVQVYTEIYGTSLIYDLNPDRIVFIVNDSDKKLLSNYIDPKNDYIDLSEFEEIKQGYNKIDFIDSVKNKILVSTDFYLDPDIILRTSDYSFDSKSLSFELKQPGVNEPIISERIKPEIDEYRFELDEDEYVFYTPNISWRIDENDWNFGSVKEVLWHEDKMLHNNCILEINNKSSKEIKLLINNKEIENSDEGCYKLGDQLTESESAKEVHVAFLIDGNTFEILNIANEEILDDFDIDIEKKTFDVKPYFIGRDDAQFHVTIEGEENSFEFDSPVSGSFDCEIEDDDYRVIIELKDFFGDGKVLLDDWYSLGNIDKVAFKHAYISLTKFNRPIKGKVKLTDVIITDLDYLGNEKETAIYSGQLNDKGKKYSVEVYKKDDNALKFFLVKEGVFKTLNYDTCSNRFTEKESDGENIIPCGSCYYIKEECE